MDEPGTTDLYPSNSVIVTGTSDKDRERLTLARMTDDVFCMTHLYSYRDFINRGSDCTQDRQEELKVHLLLFWHLSDCIVHAMNCNFYCFI